MASLLPALLFASALVVKQDAPLRVGCEASDEVVAEAPAGSPAQIRFAVNGRSETCYKVAVQVGDKTLSGFVPASALKGVEDFTRQVQNAPRLSGTTSASSAASSEAKPSLPLLQGSADHPLVKASNLIEQRQPRAALDVAEQSLRVNGRDYQSLVIAGIAASQADENRIALDYLREAQRMKEDLSVQRLIEKLERENTGDKSGEKLYGNRFLLRYENGNVHPDIAHAMVTLLEQEFSRIGSQLGCRTDERITTVVQSLEAYRATTGAAEWSGGQFDGKIRIPVAPSTTIDERTRQVFAHELVHACLANLGQFPAWLHEGIAQRLSGAQFTPSMRNNLRALMRANKVPRLENMSQSWSRLSSQHAAAAYALAFEAANLLWENYSNFGITNILRNPSMLPTITADLDKRLFDN
ncbi:MAG TPA: hypothetical protein VER03_05465 [Bryobacteraceae bacterium]|nr:hypothetical protein [Bryobacteraceae bacterium]